MKILVLITLISVTANAVVDLNQTRNRMILQISLYWSFQSENPESMGLVQLREAKLSCKDLECRRVFSDRIVNRQKSLLLEQAVLIQALGVRFDQSTEKTLTTKRAKAKEANRRSKGALEREESLKFQEDLIRTNFDIIGIQADVISKTPTPTTPQPDLTADAAPAR